ncbi:sigma factor-like helix-turn-helix DNA-binding protein [Sphingomonas ursincola]|uniref:sigma factor-like helix-turn-helix DNA-binding protein n=1 Tax=Sphingomonas ursincola TaxID=56361 RepID=UPI002355450C|nr:sigma factor-like helix-turn-helix DNA-binding protein [Sphingomonas ursincola]MBY0621282.1 RNA polymerase subunit sigma [Sphingomonas ursincola]
MSARLSRAERRRLRRAERAVDCMSSMQREIFLAIRVDELSYSEVAVLHSITVTEVEQHFAGALHILDRHMHERHHKWWQFWR